MRQILLSSKVVCDYQAKQKQERKINSQFLFIITLETMQLLLQWRKRKRWQDDWLRHPNET